MNVPMDSGTFNHRSVTDDSRIGRVLCLPVLFITGKTGHIVVM